MQKLKYLFLLISLTFFPTAIFAHALYAVGQAEGHHVTGAAYYSDSTPAAQAHVVVADTMEPNNKVEGKTDEEGNFTLNLPKALQDEAVSLQVTISGSPGHQVTVDIPRISSSKSATTEKHTTKASLLINNETAHNHSSHSHPNITSEETLKLLRQDIAELREKLYFHDIISGMGYLIGIFGLYAFWLSRRQPRASHTAPYTSQDKPKDRS